MTAKAPLASVSLDLDNQWSYMKTHGDEGWESFPSYLDVVIPRFLEILEELDMTITVFIVGQDAALEKNHAALRLIPEAGHQIGNHSFHHEPWLHLYTEDQLIEEVQRAEDAISEATGVRPRGWRGPGFSYSSTVLHVLEEKGYRYDASTFPNFIGPLARAYYFMKSSLEKEAREDRDKLFGSMAEGFKPLTPYYWSLDGDRQLLEIPVTTIPLIKTPFHLSYLSYLATYSTSLASAYFGTALRTCKMARVEPSFLLHPLDFLGEDDVPELAFFPAMNRGGTWKVKQARRFLITLQRHFQCVSMEDHATAIHQKQTLDSRPVSAEAA
ncbi:MAG: polysaccharide deacetylase family protein [Verrucomicrobiota bacterium]